MRAWIDAEVAVLDLQGRITAVNATWRDFCSSNDGDPLSCGPGTSYLDACDGVADGTSVQVGAAIRAILRGDQVTDTTFTIRCDGTDGERWFDLSTSPRFGDEAKLCGATVARWRVARPAPRPTVERRLALVPDEVTVWDLIEAFPDGTVLVDRSGLITHANRELERLSGYDRSSLLGLPIEVLVPERMRSHHAVWASGYRAAPRLRAMGAGVELTLRRSDGSELPVEISLAPVTLGDSEMSMASIRDVSARRRDADRSALVARISAMVLEDVALEVVYDEILVGARALLARYGHHVPIDDPARPGPLPPVPPAEATTELAPEGTRMAEVLSRAVRESTTEPLGGDDEQMIHDLEREIAQVLELGSARHDRERLEMLEDRQRIGRDLHDTVIQALIGIGLQLAMASRSGSDGARAVLDELLIEEIDWAIMRLRLVVFDTREAGPGISVGEAVENILAGASLTLGHVPLLVVRGDLAGLTREVVNHLVPVLREALSNVARHAQASQTTVTIDVGPDLVELSVQDNGRGLGDYRRGGGTTNFSERASMMGGSSDLGPGPDGGTVLRWTAALGRTRA